VETCFPVTHPPLYDRVRHELDLYLADNNQAWLLGTDGAYERALPGADEPRLAAQKRLMEGPLQS